MEEICVEVEKKISAMRKNYKQWLNEQEIKYENHLVSIRRKHSTLEEKCFELEKKVHKLQHNVHGLDSQEKEIQCTIDCHKNELQVILYLKLKLIVDKSVGRVSIELSKINICFKLNN